MMSSGINCEKPSPAPPVLHGGPALGSVSDAVAAGARRGGVRGWDLCQRADAQAFGNPAANRGDDAPGRQTTVISGDSAAEVNQWLTSNGFAAFSGIQITGVEEYLAKKWVFLCAKLKAQPAGLTEIPPLTVRFATPEAVYPMRLTQGAGTVPVDLYVIGRSWMADPTGRLKMGEGDRSFRQRPQRRRRSRPRPARSPVRAVEGSGTLTSAAA